MRSIGILQRGIAIILGGFIVPGLIGLVSGAPPAAAQAAANLWAWGDNRYTQLGDGTTTGRLVPTQIGGIGDLIAIDGGGSLHTVALRSDGTVWVWGDDASTGTRTEVPAQMPGISSVTAVAAGTYHTLALKSDGTVWAWGDGWLGMLGNGTFERSLAPVQVIGLSNIQDIDAGIGFSLASGKDGSVWAWGENDRGALGIEMWPKLNAPVRIDGLSEVIDVAAGGYNSYALKADGTVWAWGWNRYGQSGTTGVECSPVPGRVPGIDHATAISAGVYDCLALKSDGTVWAWGATFGKPAQVSGLASIVGIAAGDHHALAVDSEGSVWAWGSNNSEGQLGNGAASASLRPTRLTGPTGIKLVAAGDSSSFALAAPANRQNVPRPITPGAGPTPIALPQPPPPALSLAGAPGAKSVAYLYLTDTQNRDQYKQLLESAGYAVDTIPLPRVADTDLSTYSAVVVGSDTGSGYTWGNDACVASILKARRPTIGIQFGGESLFGELGLPIGANHAWTATVSSVRAADPTHPIFNTPQKITIPDSGEIPIGYSHSTWAEYGPGSGAAELLASQGNDADHYPIARDLNCVEWGFEASPDQMSAEGRALFLNTLSYVQGLPIPEPAQLLITDLAVGTAPGQPSGTWRVSASANNTGAFPGRFTLELKIDGVTESSQAIDLKPGAGQPVGFNVVRSQPGTYQVDLCGATTSFTIRPPVTTAAQAATEAAASLTTPAAQHQSSSQAAGVPWLALALIGAGIIIMGALVFLIVSTSGRRRSG